MRKSRFSEEQVICILREHEAGVSTAEVCRKHGISDATFYKWKARYGGLELSEAKRLRALEDENGRLKRLLAEAMPADCSRRGAKTTTTSDPTRPMAACHRPPRASGCATPASSAARPLPLPSPIRYDGGGLSPRTRAPRGAGQIRPQCLPVLRARPSASASRPPTPDSHRRMDPNRLRRTPVQSGR